MKKRIISAAVALTLMFVAASANTQQMTRIKVALPRNKPNGQPWDVGDGKPDIYIVVNDQSFEAFQCWDTHTCQFFTTMTGALFIEVWDKDIMHDDFAGAVECNRGYTCTANTGTRVTVR